MSLDCGVTLQPAGRAASPHTVPALGGKERPGDSCGRGCGPASEASLQSASTSQAAARAQGTGLPGRCRVRPLSGAQASGPRPARVHASPAPAREHAHQAHLQGRAPRRRSRTRRRLEAGQGRGGGKAQRPGRRAAAEVRPPGGATSGAGEGTARQAGSCGLKGQLAPSPSSPRSRPASSGSLQLLPPSP